jgi:hypothetical protein
MLRLYLRHNFYVAEFYLSGYYGHKCATNLVHVKTAIIGLLLSSLTLSTGSVTLTQNCNDSPPQFYFSPFCGTSQVTRILLFSILVIRIREIRFLFPLSVSSVSCFFSRTLKETPESCDIYCQFLSRYPVNEK